MMFSKSTVMAVAMLGVSAVDAHMLMRQPTPYGVSTLNNSPLEPDGSDFPCKLRGNTYDPPAQETIAQIGEVMPLTFTGSAVHGGGSCQVSLTTDLKPSKSSKWMVIKSIEGGCPANTVGNLPGGPDTLDPFEFNYTIPAGIEPGKYTLAWTWFNRVGNREMYMNCAPITVTGESTKTSSNFPPMFVANINGCTTTEGVDIRFPEPGDVIEYDGNPNNLQASGKPACNGVAAWTVSGVSGSGSGSGSPSTSSSPAATSSSDSGTVSVTASATATSVPEPEPSSNEPAESEAGPGVFIPTSSAVFPSPSSSASSSVSTSASGPSSTSTPTTGALTGACSPDGVWNCIGGTAFQRCANGQWTVAQELAAGTECTAGQSQEFPITATAIKPRMIHAMRYRKRGHSGRHY